VVGRIPASSPAVLAGEAAGERPGFARAPFAYSLAAGRGPEGGHGGSRRRPPLEALLR
jgi:hypothetical protein